MAGKHNGICAKIRAKITALYPKSSLAHFHCIIHQQNLRSKVLKSDHVLKLVTKTVNYIRGHAHNHRQFSQLLEDIDNQFTSLPFYTEVYWSSCHKELKRFYFRRRKAKTHKMKDESWQQDLAFAVDITAHISDLNLKLQGKGKLITELYDDIKCFINKLGLWRAQLAHDNLFHFVACKELKQTASTDSEVSFAKYNSYLDWLSKEVHATFSDFSSLEHQFTLFSAPFTCDVTTTIAQNIRLPERLWRHTQ